MPTKRSKTRPVTAAKMPVNSKAMGLVAQSAQIAKLLLQVFTLFSILNGVMAKGDHEHVQDQNSMTRHVRSLWEICGPGLLALEFAVGFCLWFLDCIPTWSSRLSFYVHGPFQFLPLVVNFMPGWVKCGTGLWWPVHWVYALVLVLSMPVLTQSDESTRKWASIPVFGCKSSRLAQTYFYITAMMTASDQYLDSMIAAIALQCEWSLAPAMVAVIFVSLFLQALAACLLNAGEGGFGVAVGVAFGIPSESYALSALERDAEIESVRKAQNYIGNYDQVPTYMTPENNDRFVDNLSTKTRNQKAAASQGLSKLLTENLPQSFLAFKFAKEVKPSKTVYFSVAMSLALATKAFVDGMAYLHRLRQQKNQKMTIAVVHA